MKILNKLTLNNLRLNKSRTLVTIIGIMLSVALITVTAGVASSGRATMVNAQITSTGDYELALGGNFNEDTLKTIEANRNVQKVYKENEVGVARLEAPKSKYRPYVTVCGVEPEAFENCFRCSLAQGRYPKNENEIVVAPSFLNNSEKEYKIGDTVTFELGSRVGIGEGMSEQEAIAEGDFISSSSSYIKNEILTKEFSKSYEIVGIFDNVNGSISFDSGSASAQVFTVADYSSQRAVACKESKLYVDYNQEGEKDYIKTTAQIMVIDESEVKDYISDSFDEEEFEQFYEKLKSGKLKASWFDVNQSLLKYKGIGMSDESMNMIYAIAFIVILIIIISSVFVIRNSFAISITEKTKLYGMMSSIGATPKQIRNNVFFEAFILGIIGISLGLLLGVGVTAGLIRLINVLLAESLNGIEIIYGISWIAIAAAVVLGGITIFLSSLTTALRASRIAPIEAIRSNKDVNISKKQKNKVYKTPWYVSKFFGVGGSVAWKNLKRSKKKYRTTVISIVVSVATFIAMFSFINYGFDMTGRYGIAEMPYNLYVSYYNDMVTFDQAAEEFDRISEIDGVKNYNYGFECYDYLLKVDDNQLTDDYLKLDESQRNYEKESAAMSMAVIAFDDATYNDLIKDLGYDYDEVKDKALFVANYVDNDTGTKKIFKDATGKNMNITCYLYDGNNNEITIKDNITVAADVSMSDNEALQTYFDEVNFVVSKEWYAEHIPEGCNYSKYMRINAEDPDKVEEEIMEMDLMDITINNEKRYVRQVNAMVTVIGIFIYGFIIVISLIGITNIFNTITTNMRLRSKEFAMMRSVGMTKREFNRMVRLESLFYGAKSLIIGIPLGLLGGFGINWAFNQSTQDISYVFPLPAVLISIAAVFAIVWVIMQFSISKVRKQNIIEIIRNDNI